MDVDYALFRAADPTAPLQLDGSTEVRGGGWCVLTPGLDTRAGGRAAKAIVQTIKGVQKLRGFLLQSFVPGTPLILMACAGGLVPHAHGA